MPLVNEEEEESAESAQSPHASQEDLRLYDSEGEELELQED